MRLALILLCLAGCADMEPSGDPLAPVAAAPAAAAPSTETPSPAAAPAPDAPASDTPPFKISSEQLQVNAAQAKAQGLLPPVATPAPDAASTIPTEGEATPAEVATAPQAATPAPVAAAPPVAATPPQSAPLSGWPVRLVKTVPEAQPPRAILSLPDGKEIVVTPGQLLPDQGLVVLGIGPNNAQLAQITPSGDHAQIAPLTLTAQY